LSRAGTAGCRQVARRLLADHAAWRRAGELRPGPRRAALELAAEEVQLRVRHEHVRMRLQILQQPGRSGLGRADDDEVGQRMDHAAPHKRPGLMEF
jgi:hypothetical protein